MKETMKEKKPWPKSPADGMKRLTLDVSESAHKKLKAYCAFNNISMRDFLSHLLETRWRKVEYGVEEGKECHDIGKNMDFSENK